MSKIISLKQNTTEWLKWRAQGIGGSDANLIAAYFLGQDYPFSTTWAGADLYKLWCQKVGRIPVKEKEDKSFGDYVDPLVHGKKEEPNARDWYNATFGEMIEPVCVEHDINSWQRASLDGWVPGVAVVEIKCPKEPKMHREAKEGTIPSYYFGQLTHNCHAASEKVVHFVSYYKGDGVMIPLAVEPRLLDELLEAEHEFRSWVEKGVYGGIPIAGEVNNLSNEWALLVRSFFDNQEKQRALEKVEREIKRKLYRQMKARKVVGGGGRVSVSVRPSTEVAAFTKAEHLFLTIDRD